MSIASFAHRGARAVRTTTAAMALVLLVSLLAIQAFQSEYGQGRQIRVIDVGDIDPALSIAVQEQESAGLTCSNQPALTDVILFQETLGGAITVVTFDHALAAAQARTGWVRSYCV